ncbi:Casein kinase I isoform delta-like protein [Tritrichomonas foetus]|uniref:Casein kinase I isoform delta-like protein n=1 Tax=Tritrichomonas foetus TaxID=1144522 RepID=A0A1J4J3J9_9EUKA|nr:Casein kinase I isoform delta-like protein [Tritrichomonas foetus]|eukprot:OHS93313.1 Casein kinase I isoform delta-like protein [Tritrichomonas foetus]
MNTKYNVNSNLYIFGNGSKKNLTLKKSDIFLMEIPPIIVQRFKVLEKINSKTNSVYFCEHLTNQSRYVVKFESTFFGGNSLQKENMIYESMSGSPGVPKVLYHGNENNYNITIVEYVGESLSSLLKKQPNKKFSLKTVLMLADQMLNLIEYLHENHYIYHLINPSNYVIGKPSEPNQLFMMNFTEALQYRDASTQQHLLIHDAPEISRNPVFAPINGHMGLAQSRRDDLESIGYVLVYLLKGCLPWKGIKEPNLREKFTKITEIKLSYSYEALCSDIPEEFVQYFKNVRSLGFDEQPNYAELRSLFRNLFIKSGFVFDYVFDWTQTMKIAPQQTPKNRRNSVKITTPTFTGDEIIRTSSYYDNIRNSNSAKALTPLSSSAPKLPALIPLTSANHRFLLEPNNIRKRVGLLKGGNSTRSSSQFFDLGQSLCCKKLL